MDQSAPSLLSSSFLSQLISQKLNHSNYLTWKHQIVPFIKSHRLYGHVDGTTLAPPKYVKREVKRTVVGNEAAGSSAGSEIRIEYEIVDNLEHELWLAHDQSLVAYITSTLLEEVLGSIDDDLTALELWTTLATTYSQVSEARFLQLRRQFQDIKRGTRTVLEYLNEIKNVSDQLSAIGHPVSDKDNVQQALSGLGTEFDIFCTAMEVLPILPSFEDLKATLFQHEASRVQRQGANMLPEHTLQDVDEPEEAVSTSLDNIPSSSQPSDPPIHNRFSGQPLHGGGASASDPSSFDLGSSSSCVVEDEPEVGPLDQMQSMDEAEMTLLDSVPGQPMVEEQGLVDSSVLLAGIKIQEANLASIKGDAIAGAPADVEAILKLCSSPPSRPLSRHGPSTSSRTMGAKEKQEDGIKDQPSKILQIRGGCTSPDLQKTPRK
ncbi:hypothetical protein EJ110_NYTH58471 [Nymphaea thermarum]|nr:hypothetical protein EJ110_NYTH58471 [Nymphaea thermarum]